MLLDLSIKELSTGVRTKRFSSEDLVRECFSQIRKTSEKTNACITIVDENVALNHARKCDNNMPSARSPLYGVPFVLKDCYITRDIQTTAASNVLKGFIPQYDATVYKKLLAAGAILIGKMNMDAWGHGGSSENTDFGPVRNPWDTTRVSGGSSGGPAVAVSTRASAFAIGEDTGGSIRNPAAWCNITGLKVTYGRVSRYGSIAYASSFDTVGPIAKTAEDCAYILKELAGVDPYDATSAPHAVDDYPALLSQSIKGKTIGMPKECYGAGLDHEIKANIETAAKKFEELGAHIKEITMPMMEYGIPVYYLIGPSETSSNLGRYDGVRYGNGREEFTEETMRRIMIGTYALSSGYYDAYYRKAQKARTLFIAEYKKALSNCDVLLMPVNPTAPPIIGELIGDPVQNLLADFYTVTQNPVGVPSLAVPCGFTKSNLPIGMQIIGPMFSEGMLLTIGHHYQQATDWHTQKPDIAL